MVHGQQAHWNIVYGRWKNVPVLDRLVQYVVTGLLGGLDSVMVHDTVFWNRLFPSGKGSLECFNTMAVFARACPSILADGSNTGKVSSRQPRTFPEDLETCSTRHSLQDELVLLLDNRYYMDKRIRTNKVVKGFVRLQELTGIIALVLAVSLLILTRRTRRGPNR